MTAVPKPLKFLRPHFEGLEKTYESWPAGDNKVCAILGLLALDAVLTRDLESACGSAFGTGHDAL